MDKNSKRVYSTNPQDRQEPEQKPAAESLPLAKQSVKIRLEKKGRKGKGVTLIEGLQVNPTHLADIAREIKQQLGTGGTAKQGVIEIQGDRRTDVEAFLVKKGVKTKRAGG